MLYVIAINNIGAGLSGGDSIWTNFVRYWKDVQVIGSYSTYKTCLQERLTCEFHPWTPRFEVTNPFSKWDIMLNTVVKLWYGCGKAWQLRKKFKDGDIIYSASDFFPDFLPALIIKLSNRRIRWVAGYYLFAPSPLSRWNPYQPDALRGVGYWIMQKVSYPLIRYFSDVVFVTSEPDKKRFKKSIVVKGGVDYPVEGAKEKKYDAIFIGRFHHQKGVLELMKYWKMVNSYLPNAKLVCVGNGALEAEVQDTAPFTVTFTGCLYGKELFDVIKQSSIVVHPATYDSGGMAMAQAMIYGLPGVMFDLPNLRGYYTHGVIKVPQKTGWGFTMAIVKLLTDQQLYANLSRDAMEFANEWTWEKVCSRISAELTAALSAQPAEASHTTDHPSL